MVIGMRCLNFKKKFKDSLLKGKKTSTLRIGVKDYRVGETVRVLAGDEEIGHARIENVKVVKWKDIKDEDVIIEGMKRKKISRGNSTGFMVRLIKTVFLPRLFSVCSIRKNEFLDVLIRSRCRQEILQSVDVIFWFCL